MALGLLITMLAACGDDKPEEPEVDPAIAPFVGTWDAEVFTVTSVADPSIVADLIGIGGSFTLNIQPSGAYTATLVFSDGETTVPLVEFGSLGVAGNFITLRPNGGDPATSQYTFVREDYLRLEGPTEFDFNFDDEPDPAEAFIEIQRR
ncbi:MAG: hypothetical protein OEN56_05995 [Gemmatimonadota bacterium]|nr:hypothetical protein [Gemmatimonadota bacterium]